MKHLLPTLTTAALLMTTSAALAAKTSHSYLPDDSFCAVYQGNIENGQKFTLWVGNNRELRIKTNRDLKVAVILQGKILPAYQIAPQPDSSVSQYAYRTSTTGNHVIHIKGVASNATITFCLE